jgi:hypothetical protein
MKNMKKLSVIASTLDMNNDEQFELSRLWTLFDITNMTWTFESHLWTRSVVDSLSIIICQFPCRTRNLIWGRHQDWWKYPLIEGEERQKLIALEWLEVEIGLGYDSDDIEEHISREMDCLACGEIARYVELAQFQKLQNIRRKDLVPCSLCQQAPDSEFLVRYLLKLMSNWYVTRKRSFEYQQICSDATLQSHWKNQGKRKSNSTLFLMTRIQSKLEKEINLKNTALTDRRIAT